MSPLVSGFMVAFPARGAGAFRCDASGRGNGGGSKVPLVAGAGVVTSVELAALDRFRFGGMLARRDVAGLSAKDQTRGRISDLSS